MRKSYLILIICTLAITIALLLAACSKGATGPAGPQGSSGLQGTAGAQGAPGPAGSQIFEGDVVPASALGNVGDYYINEQTDFLYGPKTLSGWGNGVSLQGTAGAAGIPGAPGTPGAPGSAGAAGAAGSQILSGTTTPAPATGNAGDYYFDDLTDSLYGPKTSAGWGTAVTLRGAAGADGAAGAAGQTGPQGPPGTANVIYYNWTAFNGADWSAFDPTYTRRTYSINMPAITSQILDQGVVLAYLEFVELQDKDTTQQEVDQMPAIFNNLFAPGVVYQKENLVAGLSPGLVNFYLSDALDQNDPGTIYTYISSYPTKPPSTVTDSYLYRIILIPGGVLGTNVDPHTLTYKEVCSKYGIRP